MNKFERMAYDLVKKNAPLKNFIVLCYQSIFLFKSFFSKKIKSTFDYKVIDGFFGFHDRPSLNNSGLLLIHRQIGKFENGIGVANLDLVNIVDNSTKTITKTVTCNYQQGSLATWLTDNKIILNNQINNINKCQIYHIDGSLVKELPFHFFSASKCGRYLTSISFARFGKGLNGYGYNINYPDDECKDANNKIPKSNFGDIFIYDILEDKEIYRHSILSLKEKSYGLIDDGYFYFSHSNFSPDSKYLYFLIRSSNNKINTSQLLIKDLNSGNILYAPTNGMVSHLDWISSDKVIAYCNCVQDKKDGYYVFTIKDGKISAERLPIARLSSDGHPSSISQKKFITDTYPDRSRSQFLIMVDIEKNSSIDIAQLYSPLKFRGVNRTDLHPRVSRCKQYLTIDTSYRNKRSQLIIDLKSIKFN